MVLMSLIKPLLPTVIPLFASTVVVVVEPLHTSSDLYYTPVEPVIFEFRARARSFLGLAPLVPSSSPIHRLSHLRKGETP